MKEIKSVRVRRKFASTDENLNGLSDYKVTLYDNGRNKFKVGALQTGKVALFAEYRKSGIFKDFSNDDFIKDGINVLISKQNDNKEFEIIQDPWLDTPPKWRSFGSTPYYLNNGAQVAIQWLIGNSNAGGRKWSDDNGEELRTSKNLDDDPKFFITKIVKIWAPNSYDGKNERLIITRLGIEGVIDSKGNPIPFTDDKKYSGLMLDKDIIDNIISIWNGKVPNYNLSLCEPDYIRCEVIPYISPVDELQDIEEKLEIPETQEEPDFIKEKLNVVLPKDINIRTGQDISFKIFVGDPPKTEKPAVDGFDFGDEDDLSDLLLEDEFRETDFSGLDESQLEIQEYPDEKTRVETESQAQLINSQPYVPGKYTLDLIPGAFLGNDKKAITCCNIDGKPVNVKIADAVLDMKAAAKKDGVNLLVTSGFRPGFSPSINTKSQSGVKITAQSQEELYKQNCVGKAKCSPATAGAGRSKHGNGIAVDFNTGSRGGAIKSPLNASVYSWLVKNSWRFGFVRTVSSEEWHFEYWSDKSKSGPYAVLPKNNKLFYSDLGLNNLQIA
jgi:LAS superfamily LD-carboxypeptidase LdcB